MTPDAAPLAWRWCQTVAGACPTPSTISATQSWTACARPATVAALLRDAGKFDPALPPTLDQFDFWFMATLDFEAPHRLVCDCLAGETEIWWRGALVARQDTMFAPLEIALPAPHRGALHLRFPAAGAGAARLPRARWRARLADAAMRGRRQTLLGRMPGWMPALRAVGPVTPPRLEPDLAAGWRVTRLRADYDGEAGHLSVGIAPHEPPPSRLSCAGVSLTFAPAPGGGWSAAGVIPGVAPWIPHTHGEPALHELRLHDGDGGERSLGPIGFRRIEARPATDGFGLIVNGVPIFARGVCWTPLDSVGLDPPDAAYDAALAALRDGGVNMVRVGGTMTYEKEAFFAACDRLGILVWQDFMFANFDYPAALPGFLDRVEAEVTHLLGRNRAHASLAVLCGGSEVRQQAEMAGAAWPEAEPLFEGLIARLCAAERPDLPYLPNTPWGGAPCFSTDAGVTHYYGVGAYLRPLADIRRADVRFAAECLGVAHLPAAADLAQAAARQPLDAAWKRATPRDPGAAYDFDDVRDHYVGALYGADPARLRREDPARYLDLGRAVSCDLAEALFSEWRRPGSACAGGLVWQLRDVIEGAGWGVWTEAARPKPVWHALSRLFRPVQLLLTDEGLNGIAAHVVNETAAPVELLLELTALRDGAQAVATASRKLSLPARGALTLSGAELLGRFFDISYAYRFGPPAHDVTAAVLRDAATGALRGVACHLPDRRLPRAELGFEAEIAPSPPGHLLRLQTRRFAQYVHVTSASHEPGDDWFHLPPDLTTEIPLRRRSGRPTPSGVTISALNAARPLSIHDFDDR